MSDELAARFEADRAHLRAVAHRMLGSPSQAEDAVQEAWLCLGRADTREVTNLTGWLTTVVARVCLDMLRARAARREEPLDAVDAAGTRGAHDGADPEAEAVAADAVGAALVVVLDTLAPAERLAFVLHDLFGVPFDEIAPIVERTPEAARQLASRARRRLRGATPGGAADVARRRRVVEAFLAASRGGDFDALLALLDPDVVLRADDAAVRMGALAEMRGAHAVATRFSGHARAARLALVDGAPGAAWMQGRTPRAAFRFTLDVERGDRIVAIEIVMEPARVEALGVQLLDA